MVLVILATGILYSVLYALRLQNTYTSTASLMPPDGASLNTNVMGLLSASGSGAAASAGSALLGVKTPGAIFVGIMGSRTVQEGVVNQFDLVHHYKALSVEDACKQLSADTVIQNDLKNGIITISVKADDRVLASHLAQGYIVELNRIVTSNSTSAARRERVFLEGRLKEIKADLDDSAQALSRFSAKSRTIDIPTQGRAMVESGLKLQDQLAAARSDLVALRQVYTADNIRVRSASARVEELQRNIDRMIGGPQGNAESRIGESQSAYPSVSELPALGLTYAELERKLRVEEALWDALTRQYESARVQEAKEIPTVRVLDVANVPERKSGPNRSHIVILGAFLSFALALVAVRAIAVFEALGPQDEPKKLITEIVGLALDSDSRLWKVPGLNRVHTRIKGRGQQ